jgi:hypothetical protein
MVKTKITIPRPKAVARTIDGRVIRRFRVK